MDDRVSTHRAESRYGGDLVAFTVLVLALTLVPFGLLRAAGGDDATGSPWFVLMTSSPTLAALVLWVVGRRRSRDDRTGRVHWHACGVWAVAGLLLGGGPVVLGVLLGSLLGGPALDLAQPATTVADVGGALPVVAMLLLGGPLAEEPGWRGYLQPRLRHWLSPVGTVVVVGLVWAVWHVPLFFVPGTSQADRPIASTLGLLSLATFVPLASVFWFVSERLGGGVVGAVVTHVGFNGASALLGNDAVGAIAAQVAVLVLLAVVLHVAAARPARAVRGA